MGLTPTYGIRHQKISSSWMRAPCPLAVVGWAEGVGFPSHLVASFSLSGGQSRFQLMGSYRTVDCRTCSRSLVVLFLSNGPWFKSCEGGVTKGIQP